MSTTTNRRPTVDGVLKTLADERRRAILEFLYDRSKPVDVEDVAAYLDGRTDADDESLVEKLHHVHLPALEEVGLLRYDPAAGRIRPRDSVTDAGRLNTLLREADRIAPGG